VALKINFGNSNKPSGSLNVSYFCSSRMRITINCTSKLLGHDQRGSLDGGVELGLSTLCYFISLKRPPASVNQPQEHISSEVHHADWDNEYSCEQETIRLEGDMA
jgi:hypothetical protein